jgi:hypothetical protein
MSKLAIWAQLKAKPGKEKEVEAFLKSAQPLAEREPGTISWYAIKMAPENTASLTPSPMKMAGMHTSTGKSPKPFSPKRMTSLRSRQKWQNLKFSRQNRFVPDFLNPPCPCSYP